MSAIDHAFIRAYTTDAVSTGETSAVATPQPVSYDILSNTDLAVEQDALATTATLDRAPSRPGLTEPQADRPRTVVPAPHLDLAAFANIRLSAGTDRAEATAPPRHSISHPATEATAVSLAEIATEPAGTLLRPAYEVDRFSWPDLCDKLTAATRLPLDQLAATLMTESALGRRVIAVTGCRRGEGRSTLALALARRLTASGAKLALVDADFSHPQLAQRLGVVSEQGWESVLSGRLPVWEAMIESIDDRLTLLPWVSGVETSTTTSSSGLAGHAASLEVLRQHFDVVLVDAAPLTPADGAGGWLTTPGSGVDAAIVVCDSRSGLPPQWADVSRRLLDARITPLGMAVNFCAG